MAVANDYVTGTITLTNGSINFTGAGTAWRLAGFRGGDYVDVDNLHAVIAPTSPTDPLIDSNTSGKLTVPWTGTTGTRTYRMSYKPDGARVTAETRNLIELLGNGNLEAIAALTPTVNALIRGNAGGTAWEKFNATAAGFALLDDANASAQLTTLGVSAFMKTMLDDADAPAARTTIGLGNVDNTSDANKPVSTAQATALSGKLSLSGGAMTGPLDIGYSVDTNFGIRFTQTYTIANGGTLRIGTEGSGFLVATSHTTADTAIYIVGSGIVNLVAQTATVFGTASTGGGMKLQYAAPPTGYYFGNITGNAHTLGIAFLRTRPAA